MTAPLSLARRRDIAYALLRATIGIVFLTTGTKKWLHGVDAFAGGLREMFAGKLPAVLVNPFAYAVPYVEIAVGVLLVLGALNVPALIVSALLMISLTFGMMVAGESATVAANLSYAIIIFILLWSSEHNRYSVDGLRRGGFLPRPAS